MSNNASIKANEKEITIYAKIGDMEGLKQANRIEKHEQAEGEFKTGERCRIRVVEFVGGEKDGQVDYSFTIKAKNKDNVDGLNNVVESTIAIDKGFMQAFVAAGAHRLISKTRHTFASSTVTIIVDGQKHSIPNILYEVDVFNKIDGSGVSEWAKIDVEVDAVEAYVKEHFPEVKDVKLTIGISHLPFKPENGIVMLNASDEQKEFVGQLYETQWVKKVNQDKENIAVESILDIVKNAFDKITDKEGKRRESQKLIENGDLKEIKKYLKDHYLNEDWINRQTMVLEPVSAKGIVGLICKDGKFDENNFLNVISNGIKESEAVTKEFNKYLKEHSDEVKKIDKETRKEIKSLDRNDPDHVDKINEILEKVIERLKSIPSPTEKIEKRKYIALSEDVPFSRESKGHLYLRSSKSSFLPTKIRPLDKSEVFEVTQYVLELLEKDLTEAYSSWSDHSDGDSFWEIIEYSGYDDDYARLVYWQSVEQSLNLEEYLCGYLLKQRIIIALVTWMYRSIK